MGLTSNEKVTSFAGACFPEIYDLLHDHRVKSHDTREDYFKMVHPGTDRFVVELCRNKHTNEGKRASRGKRTVS